MNQTEKALSLAEEIGGKDRLNCIAELGSTAVSQTVALDKGGSHQLPLWSVPVLVKDMMPS